jgi:hypothetical protein
MDRLLNVMAVASLLLIGMVLAAVRREHIRVEYSVSWLAAGVALLVLSTFRGLDETIAFALGVPFAALVPLTLSGFVFFLVLFQLSLRISGLKDSNVKLAQRVAILEYRLESLTEANGRETHQREN